MCKYCQGLANNEFRKFAAGTYADLYQGFCEIGSYQLKFDMHPCPPYVDCANNVCYRGEKKGFRRPALTQNSSINFCPNCGRDLREDAKSQKADQEVRKRRWII